MPSSRLTTYEAAFGTLAGLQFAAEAVMEVGVKGGVRARGDAAVERERPGRQQPARRNLVIGSRTAGDRSGNACARRRGSERAAIQCDRTRAQWRSAADDERAIA